MQSALHALRQFMHARTGVQLGPDKDYLIHSRLHAVPQAAALPDLRALVQALQAAPTGPLAQAVVSALTTHETYWFRDQRPFERLRTEVLPLWRKRAQRDIRIWSAACSSGQEPYSIAMLLREEGLLSPDWQVRLLASDICDTVLAQASAGLYGAFELERGLPEHLRRRYFTPVGAQWQVQPVLTDMVRFQVTNLVQLGAANETFDLIFCRNVLIYFDRATQQKVLCALQQRLAPGGLLFLGPSESPLGLCDALRPWGEGSGVYCSRTEALNPSTGAT
jgi:chemotaxis protein methyltransferase CheR